MEKITFLIPPSLDGKNILDRVAGCSYTVYNVPNIFVLISLAALREKGFTVVYEDFSINKKNKEDFIDFLKNDASDLYIFYTVNLSMKIDLKAVDIIKNIRADVPIIFFGPSPTFWPEKFLKDESIYVVRGEPEITICELATAIKIRRDISGVAGVSYYKTGVIINNDPRPLIKDLDSLPFASRDLLDRDRYFNPKLRRRPFTTIFTSRGCSYRCIFCVPTSLNFAIELEYKKYFNKKPPVRLRSAESAIKEFKLLRQQGYKAVSIWDDLFVWGKNRTIEICRGIKDLGLIWGCQSRADHLNEDIVREMAKAGCKYIDIGVESFCQEILDYVKKDIKTETLQEAIKIIKKYNISAKVNVIFGVCPLETKDTINQTQKIIRQLNIDQVMYNICTPFPGTELYDIAKKEGWFIKGEYEPFDVAKKAIITLPHLTNKELEVLVKKANFSFFLDPKFIAKNLFKTGFFRLNNLKDTIKALMRKLT